MNGEVAHHATTNMAYVGSKGGDKTMAKNLADIQYPVRPGNNKARANYQPQMYFLKVQQVNEGWHRNI